MPATETPEAPPVREIVVAPFGIEADHPRCSDLYIQCIPNLRLRSSIDGSRPARDSKTGDMVTPRDQAINMGDFPKTPGMQLHVNPLELTYVVVDPLADMPDMQERVVKWMNNHTPFRGDKIKIDKKLEGKIDVHQMKSLCREMFNLMKDGEAKHVRGSKPDMSEIDLLPGKYLLNPGSRVMNTQPRFEVDFDSWVEKLANQGG